MSSNPSVDGLHADRSQTRRLQHEGNGSVVTTIALGIAELEGVDPTELEPLYGAVDPELLERLCNGVHQITGDVMFTYSGYRVTVDSHGTILLSQAVDDTPN